MRQIKITLQYDGTDYFGWQVQKTQPTVQGIVEDALFAVTGEEKRVMGASRTDTGVHAFDQNAVFRTGSNLKPETLLRALNANLPEDIFITKCTEVDSEFHPRYSAKNKTYAYLITGKQSHSVFLRRYSWQIPFRLDCNAMVNAAKHITGMQNFSSFQASGCSAKSPVREVSHIEVNESMEVDFMGFRFPCPAVKVSIKANAFLRHMVRNIVGTLVDAGRGRIQPGDVEKIIAAQDRRFAGKTAPSCGLFLEKIEY